MSAGGFIRRVRHLALFDGNAVPPPISTTPAFVQLQQIRNCGWLIQHMAHFQPGRFSTLMEIRGSILEEMVAAWLKRTELLLKSVEMATNNGDRTEEIPDDAVADHIGPVEHTATG